MCWLILCQCEKTRAVMEEGASFGKMPLWDEAYRQDCRIIDREGSSPLWRHPSAVGPKLFKKVGWIGWKAQARKQHSSIASSSAPVRSLVWVPVLTFFSDEQWCGSIIWNRYFLWGNVFLSIQKHIIPIQYGQPFLRLWGNFKCKS